MPNQLPQEPLPDFAGPEYDGDRQDLTDAGLSPADAVTCLRTMHLAQQKKDRDAHERVRRETIIARAEEEERADLLRQQQEDDEEQALKEERKKNKAKFAPIPDVPVPTEPVMVPAHIALRKLKLNQYVEMWYWTNDGLDTADRL
ncbi:hypothetical protein L210DRAFT_3647514 [Boletus edulis BED1]|uniref:Uncharacterized protein n=1 Tax=Boletus edulis BED1 TaxID=1328754 RepID=A0AAD4BQS3_BOLED|nr:hypothetical protein L210DRAFT_3647514 [Boletus edulis BED1]